MNDIQIFNSPEFGEVRTVMIDDEPWFVGNDVAKSLGYSRVREAIKTNVDEMDTSLMGVTDSIGRTQQTTVINESGLYSLIFGSKLPSAKKFKRWVTSEVLPALRKTGKYEAPKTPMTTQQQIQLLAQGSVELNQKVDNLSERMDKFESDMPILPIEADRITSAVRKRGLDILGGMFAPAYMNKSIRAKVYHAIYANLKYNFGVSSYKSIKRSQCDKAVEILQAFDAPYFLQEQIDSENCQQKLKL